jgi:hypothetical protein
MADKGKGTFKLLAEKRAAIDKLSKEVGVKSPSAGQTTRVVDKKRKAKKGTIGEVKAEGKATMEKAKNPNFTKEKQTVYKKARDAAISVINKIRGIGPK